MADTYTGNYNLVKIEQGTTGWASKANGNMDTIDLSLSGLNTNILSLSNNISVTANGNFGSPTNYEAIVGSTFVPDFMYVNGSHRIHSRSLMLAEINDTVDLAIRRWNGSYASPTPVLDGEFIGNIYWQAYGTDSLFDHASPGYGRICQIAGQCIGAQTGSSRGGTMVFFTTPNGDMETRERVWISDKGWLVCAGQANNEWGGAMNAQNHFGKGSLTVYSPPNASLSTQSAIAIRKYGTETTGYDIDFNDSTNSIIFSSVASDTKTSCVEFGGSYSFIQTSTGDGPNTTIKNLSDSTPDTYRFVSFRTGASSTERGTIDYNSGTTGVRYNITSDKRLKENIVPCLESGEVIDNLNVRQYVWKETGYVTRFGLIAQELYDIFPEAVSVGDDTDSINKVWGVDYSKIVPLLIREIQSLRRKIK